VAPSLALGRTRDVSYDRNSAIHWRPTVSHLSVPVILLVMQVSSQSVFSLSTKRLKQKGSSKRRGLRGQWAHGGDLRKRSLRWVRAESTQKLMPGDVLRSRHSGSLFSFIRYRHCELRYACVRNSSCSLSLPSSLLASRIVPSQCKDNPSEPNH
jgi:hypothetical protein